MGNHTLWGVISTPYHERDLPGGLGLSVNDDDTADEDEEGHGQGGQDPGLHGKEGVAVVCGEIADHTHHHDCRQDTHSQ